MNRHLSIIPRFLATAFLACLFIGCNQDDSADSASNRDVIASLHEFIPTYNNYIEQKLVNRKDEILKQIADLESKVKDEGSSEKNATRDLEKELERINYRLGHDGYFTLASEEDIPDNLVWQDGMDQPEIGDPRATKGGVFRMPVASFPPTLRRYGAKSNHGYRDYMYDDVELPLVGIHPITQQYIPGVAKRWALGEDGRTMFYEIDPRAEYTDGQPVRAIDYMLGIYVRSSDNVVDPYYKQYLSDQIANITVYDDYHLSISLPDKKPLLPLYASVLPASPKFYAEYGPDFKERYNWRFEPTTGPYYLDEKDLLKGRGFTLTRKKDWWAKDDKYTKNQFNVDRIVFTLVRNTAKQFEMFRAAEFDYARVTTPEMWYEKSEIEPVFDGYIERFTFFNQYPRVNRGFYFNTLQPLVSDKNIRIGFAHATNWQRVIDAIFQGDFSRLPQFSAGFGPYTNPDVSARTYSVQKARDYFAKAGFTKEGEDGILINNEGTRLSITIVSRSLPLYKKMMNIIKEEARKAGLEIVIDAKEPTAAFKYSSEKKHQVVFSGFGVTPPFPVYHQFLHSSNAINEDGTPKPATNNIFGWADPRTDRLSLAIQYASDLETIKTASWKIQQLIYDECIFVPAFMTDYVRVASWRWVEWPDTEQTPFCIPIIYEPFESHLFWINSEKKTETKQAMRSGKKFPEVQRTIADFREWSPDLTEPLPAPTDKEAKQPEPVQP